MNENISLEEDLYTIVNNDVLKDKTLSMQAKGLYAYLRSNSKDWKLYKTEVYNHFTNGRDAINKAWKELVDQGWIVSKRIKTEGKMDGWHHEVKRTTLPTYWKSVNRESRQSENPQLINNNNNKYQNNNNNNNNKASGDAVEIPEYFDLELWEEYLKNRKSMKVKNTPRALKTLINKIQKIEDIKQGAGMEALEEANSRGWKSVVDPFEQKPFMNSKGFKQQSDACEPRKIRKL